MNRDRRSLIAGLLVATSLAAAGLAPAPDGRADTLNAPAKVLPGFHPDLEACGLDPVDDPDHPRLDLTLFCAGWVDGRVVFRLGTREVFPGSGEGSIVLERDLPAGAGESVERVSFTSDGSCEWEVFEAGRTLAAGTLSAEIRRMPGAVVFELWMPSTWSADRDRREWAGQARSVYSMTGDDAREACDQLEVRPAVASRDGSRADHHVAFLHHGNQGLTWTDVLWGDEDYAHEQHFDDYLDTDSEHNGFDEILGLHDVLDVPANFQVAGPLQTAAEWYYPDGAVEGWNDWLARGVTEGWAAIVGTAYAQQIMPFLTDSMNNWSVHVHTDMSEWRYGYTPHTAWVPERVWVSPEDLDGNPWDTSPHVNDWIGDNWLPHDIWAVVLDQDEHCVEENTWWNDRHIYTISVPGQGDLNIIPINGPFTGNCHWDAGAAWNDIIGTSADELLVYGTDWEVVSEVAGYGEQFPDALNNMIWIIQQIAGSGGTVESMNLDAALGDFSGGAINLHNATYGMLGGRGGYGSDWLTPGTHNSWYGDWAVTPCHSDQHDPQWDYGTVWDATWNTLMACPSNDLSETGWYVMMTNLYETGWHDGEEVSGWIHRYASHVKNANVYAEASHWVAGEYAIVTNAYASDIDQDGVDELVLHNDRVFAVFESIGGRAPWIFCKGPGYDGSVVGSCNAYWVETEGDYNDGSSNNHVAAFSDVSPSQEHVLYAMGVDSVAADFARVTMSYGGVTKTFSLLEGDTWITVDYESTGDVYVKHGFTPDYIDLLWNAESDRLWDPYASWPQTDWCGQRNPNTGLTAALVLGNGGCLHSMDFQGTIVRGDELRGGNRFRYLFYAGETSEPDPQGVVAELEALAQTNMDVAAPRLAAVAAFVAPDIAVLDFSEAVDESSAEDLGNYQLSGFPGGVAMVSAERQPDLSLVWLHLSGLSSGDTGNISAPGVTDLNGNPVEPGYDTAVLTVPNGLTPHTILIDGTSDFITGTEWMGEPDSLWLTWDSENLYIGHYGTNLGGGGDFFVYLDTDLAPSSGASRSSWDRVSFSSSNRPEHEIAVEGGGNSMQINSWSGSWSYRQYSEHDGESYEGWSGNLMTELKIPWDEIGDPAGLAVSASLSQEDNWMTDLSWPGTNPTGYNITISDWWVFAEPDLPGPMPAMGVAPNNPQPGLNPVDDLSIERSGEDHVLLTWSPVAGATLYRVYSAEDPYVLPGGGVLEAEQAEQELYLPIDGPRRFYVVVAADE